MKSEDVDVDVSELGEKSNQRRKRRVFIQIPPHCRDTLALASVSFLSSAHTHTAQLKDAIN